MTQGERDRLLALKKAKKLITQREAAAELGVTERHVRRLLHELKRCGDQAVDTRCEAGRRIGRSMWKPNRSGVNPSVETNRVSTLSR